MKKAYTILFLLVAPSIILAQSQAGRMPALSEAEQEVLSLNQKWADAIAAGDMQTLDRLFHQDLIVTAGTGTFKNKKAELDDLRPAPNIKLYFFKVDELDARVHGNTAAVTGRARWKINLNGRDIEHERRYISVFVKHEGEWKILAQHLVRIPQQQAK